MPPLPKASLLAFAKRSAAPKYPATLLAKKRATVKAAPPPGGVPAAKEIEPPQADGGPLFMSELVEEAAQEAEAGKDTDLEDRIAGYTENQSEPGEVPPWATDPDKWAEAVDAVGLGTDDADRYDEPYAVAAYLYKKMGGTFDGDGEQGSDDDGGPSDGSPNDMGTPGAAARALKNAHNERAKKDPAASATPASGAAPVPKHKAPGGDQPPAGSDSGDDSGELKQMLDDAADQANSGEDPDLDAKLADYDPDRDGNPPQWASDADRWQKAWEAVDPHWEDYENPVAVVAYVYKNMGGEVI